MINILMAWAVMLCLLSGAGIYWFVQAGELEPPGDPAPTMVTLQQIYDKLDGLTLGEAPLAATGQTDCWDGSGNLVVCDGTGQDGEYQAGVSIASRFTDNLDGTVKDNLSGQDSPRGTEASWAALTH